jgi:hypothetical protein
MWMSSMDVPGPLVDELVATCLAHGVHLVIGVNERESERPGMLYNAMLWPGPDGLAWASRATCSAATAGTASLQKQIRRHPRRAQHAGREEQRLHRAAGTGRGAQSAARPPQVAMAGHQRLTERAQTVGSIAHYDELLAPLYRQDQRPSSVSGGRATRER